jgi:protease I
MQQVMQLQGKRIAILAEELYQELELWYPLLRFRGAGAEVLVVGSGSAKEHKSKYGYPVPVDKFAHEVEAHQLDAVIIPGGYAPDHMRRCEPMIKLTSQMAEQGKVVAAICHGPWMLCSTQALKGKKATCFFAIKDDVINAGGKYMDAEVVRDGNLITSRKPDDLPAFMQSIIQAAREAKPALAGARS